MINKEIRNTRVIATLNILLSSEVKLTNLTDMQIQHICKLHWACGKLLYAQLYHILTLTLNRGGRHLAEKHLCQHYEVIIEDGTHFLFNFQSNPVKTQECMHDETETIPKLHHGCCEICVYIHKLLQNLMFGS